MDTIAPLGTEVVRSQEEIVTYIDRMKNEDPFGFTTTVLVVELDFEHARPFLKPEVTADEWAETVEDRKPVHAEAVEYLGFAVDKAISHRGISASRSVFKLSAWCWLLGGPTLQELERDVPYAQYGAPQLVRLSQLLDHRPEDMDDPAFQRMADGLRCDPEGCDEGCGR